MKVIAIREGRSQTLHCQTCHAEEVLSPVVEAHASASCVHAVTVVRFRCQQEGHCSQYLLANAMIKFEK